MNRETVRPLHSPVKALKKLRAGQTVYSIHALGAQSFLSKYTVMGKPTVQTTVTIYEKGTKEEVSFSSVFEGIELSRYNEYAGKYISGNRSLRDMNVLPNSYNEHRLFHSRRKAEAYLKLCLQETINGYNERREAEDWDFIDCMEDNYNPYDDEILDDEEGVVDRFNDRAAQDDFENIGV